MLKLPLVAPKLSLHRFQKKEKKKKNCVLQKIFFHFSVFTSWKWFWGSIPIKKIVWERWARQKFFWKFRFILMYFPIEVFWRFSLFLIPFGNTSACKLKKIIQKNVNYDWSYKVNNTNTDFHQILWIFLTTGLDSAWNFASKIMFCIFYLANGRSSGVKCEKRTFFKSIIIYFMSHNTFPRKCAMLIFVQ